MNLLGRLGDMGFVRRTFIEAWAHGRRPIVVVDSLQWVTTRTQRGVSAEFTKPLGQAQSSFGRLHLRLVHVLSIKESTAPTNVRFRDHLICSNAACLQGSLAKEAGGAASIGSPI